MTCLTLVTIFASVTPAVAERTPRLSNPADGVKVKKAEKKAILSDLEEMRTDLTRQIDKYVATGKRIIQARAEIDEVTKEIADQDVALANAEQALVDRAVQLYRSDRLGMMQILLTSDSIPQLLDRMSYLVAAGRHDTELIDRVQLERQESLWLQQSLSDRVALLNELRESADEQRVLIEKEIDAEQAKLDAIGQDIAVLERMQTGAKPIANAGSAPQSPYTPATIISQQRFDDVAAMNVQGIQAFLDEQPGALKYYRGPDHNGKTRSAAEMIADAAAAWSVSPNVILITLQKEQSLLSQRNPSQRAMNWAMGCGKMDGSTISKFAGFGNQIWFGAKVLRVNADRWKPGVQLSIDGTTVVPTNKATYGLYRYTPHLRGNMSFWMLHWRYFGDPLSMPNYL